MDIYIKYGQDKYFQYHAPIVPRTGEVIVLDDINDSGKQYRFLVKIVEHYAIDEHYEVTLICELLKEVE